MASYMRKTADPPNPAQYDMSPFDTTISPSFATKNDINIEPPLKCHVSLFFFGISQEIPNIETVPICL
ncbi:hypothetical protein T4A_10156 [Trichinella pseudospiralis]|uniref:Uncharacterized protein n=1 Tax=Trichinella pseudospiralis TaxID=6337 RepID=A0A0V1DZW1_TRIPS|nr:hypothetical protein T4A_10156 [Trichinella pseudospiralis]